jgi:TPR repeat protein
LPASAALPTGAQNKKQVDASSSDQTADSQLAHRNAPVSANSSAVDQSGALELATAQNYLTGSPGTRNSAEAVQWLWKAVGKRNLEATLTLSDLYLRGDGVPKSCDQARLLLDAAARKGAKAAAERLRNLQASGCQ